MRGMSVFTHYSTNSELLLKPMFFRKCLKSILCLFTEANSSEKKIAVALTIAEKVAVLDELTETAARFFHSDHFLAPYPRCVIRPNVL